MWFAWGRERCLQGFGWEARGQEPLGRPRRRWEDNIKMNLREIGIDGVNWIRLAEDRVQWWAFVKGSKVEYIFTWYYKTKYLTQKLILSSR
jgi:hypothetical protein